MMTLIEDNYKRKNLPKHITQAITYRYCNTCNKIKKFRYNLKKKHSRCLTCKGFKCISLIHAYNKNLISKEEYEKYKYRTGRLIKC